MEHYDFVRPLTPDHFCGSRGRLRSILGSAREPITPLRYHGIDVLYGTYFRVWIDDLCGVVDATGALVVPMHFDDIQHVTADSFKVWRDEHVGIFTSSLERLAIPVWYDVIEHHDGAIYWAGRDDLPRVHFFNIETGVQTTL